MKKTIIFSLVLLVNIISSSFLFAQKTKTAPATTPSPTPSVTPQASASEIALQQAIYKNALKYGDPGMAKSALFHLMELDKNNPTFKYRDSLLNIYYGSQAYVSAVLLGRELHTENPTNQSTLAILALAEQNLGLGVESLEHYKKLYMLSKNPSDLYQAGAIEFKLQRYLECVQSLNEVIMNPASEKEKVYMSYDQRQGQEVPLKAAALNIKGYVAATTGKKEEAQALYNQALAIAPDFALAKNNLEMLLNPPKESQKK